MLKCKYLQAPFGQARYSIGILGYIRNIYIYMNIQLSMLESTRTKWWSHVRTCAGRDEWTDEIHCIAASMAKWQVTTIFRHQRKGMSYSEANQLIFWSFLVVHVNVLLTQRHRRFGARAWQERRKDARRRTRPAWQHPDGGCSAPATMWLLPGGVPGLVESRLNIFSWRLVLAKPRYSHSKAVLVPLSSLSKCAISARMGRLSSLLDTEAK